MPHRFDWRYEVLMHNGCVILASSVPPQLKPVHPQKPFEELWVRGGDVADGINAVAPFIDIVKDKKAPLIITPHPGEMARLIGESVDYVCSHRLEVAKAFAKENDVIIVLKGANTIVTNGVDVYFNTTGNPGMAMGGTGDMLAGIIGSFAAQGIEPIEACKAAVYIHGRCGDIAAQEISTRGMTVDDMIYVLGALMSEFE